jgi:ABC-type transport system involved in multi-copper enzyme maturation permease subunit
MNQILAISQIVLKESYRRKDFYVLLILTVLISLVLGSTNFFNEKGIVRYIKEFCLLLIWISSLVMALATAARQLPSERESRTIFPLLAKPISRTQVILGKFLGCAIAMALAVLVFYLCFLTLTFTKNDHLNFALLAQAIWLHVCFLSIVCSLALLGSLIFTTPSANITILVIMILGTLFLGPHLSKLAMRMVEPSQSVVLTVYYLLPHFEFFDVRDLVVHNHPPVPWWAVGIASLYAASFCGLFLLGACLVFKKQSLSR